MKTDRQKVLEKYGCRCAYCGGAITMKTMQVDHIISKDRWRTAMYYIEDEPKFLQHLKEKDIDHFDNLNPACRPCNLYKHRDSLDGFRKHLSKQVARARKYSNNFRMAERYNLIKETGESVIFYFEKELPF